MKIIWLGHSGFRIEIGDSVLLVDPWLKGNPMFPEDKSVEAITGATHVALTHGHGDHASNALTIARELGVPILCIHELAEIWSGDDGIEVTGFGKGGTLELGDGVSITMTHAIHSSSVDFLGGAPQYAGEPAGFIIRGEGHAIYVTGDTDVMADMAVIAERYMPDIGILCAGGHYTMDMEGAAYAASRYFEFKTVIPCHYKTFPILAQSAQPLIEALPEVQVIEPEVLAAIAI